MNKKEKELRELTKKRTGLETKINEMANVLEKEKRMMNDGEKKEYSELLRQKQLVDMRMNGIALGIADERENPLGEAEKLIRESIDAKQPVEVVLTRESVIVSQNTTEGGIAPVRIQDIMDPIKEGLIHDKVGIPFHTGVTGKFYYPSYEIAEAQIANEKVALTDTKLDLKKLAPVPQRTGVAIPVTREAINDSNNVIVDIIQRAIPMAMAQLINRVMFGKEKAPGATSLVGPFVALKSGAKACATDSPTFLEYNGLKAQCLTAGIDGKHLCYVMTEAQKAIAEGTPMDAGSGRMVCENDKISGVPVFCTHYIGEGYIGIGDWQYQPVQVFGNPTLIIDPYTKARNNEIDFILNCDLATTTLVEDAFKLMKTKSAV